MHASVAYATALTASIRQGGTAAVCSTSCQRTGLKKTSTVAELGYCVTGTAVARTGAVASSQIDVS